MKTIHHIRLYRLIDSNILNVGIITVLSDEITRQGSILWEGVSIELPWNENKKNVSCIPVGEYFLAYREDRKRWELQNVPSRSGIQIHGGTKPEHSKGCIVLPDIKGFDKVLDPYRSHILKINIL